MGNGINASQHILYSTMLVIGGCELSLERNPVGLIDQISLDKEANRFVRRKYEHSLTIPVRSPTAALYENKLFVVGGCRAKRDHISDVQILDLKQNDGWTVSDSMKLHHARSCHMSTLFGHNLYVMGGWDGYDCLNSIEKADLSVN